MGSHRAGEAHPGRPGSGGDREPGHPAARCPGAVPAQGREPGAGRVARRVALRHLPGRQAAPGVQMSAVVRWLLLTVAIAPGTAVPLPAMGPLVLLAGTGRNPRPGRSSRPPWPGPSAFARDL